MRRPARTRSARTLRVLLAGMCAIMLLAGGGLGTRGAPAVGSPVTVVNPEDWVLSTTRFDNTDTAEPYVGNGYFSQRIPAAGAGLLTGQGKSGWPLDTPRDSQALAAGVYADTTASRIYPAAKQVIALIPTWSSLTFSTPSGTYSPATVTAASIRDYRQTEDLRTGTVTTSGTWTAPGGERTRFSYQVFTDRAREHVGVVTLRLTPLWTGTAGVTNLLDGAGASRLDPVDAGADTATHTVHVTSKATGTGTPVAEAATLRGTGYTATLDTAVGSDRPQTAGERLGFPVTSGRSYTFQKYVAVVTGRDSAAAPADAGREVTRAARTGLGALQAENRKAWDSVWHSDIVLDGARGLQTMVRATEYNLYASIRPDSPDALGPSGLSSDGYAGMVFWDSDLWMFPAILAAHPDIARVLVDYRYHTLTAAQHNATANGYQGAFYPWTAGDDGRIGADCYGTTADGNDKITDDPNKSCSQELHLQADIAIAQWQYYRATHDRGWLSGHGWPVLRAIAQFWTSKATPAAGGGYRVTKVQPPDEQHTDVDDSVYTNAAAATALRAAVSAARELGQTAPAQWTTVADGLVRTMPFDRDKKIYLEYDGYRGDQIKQADAVMLSYPLDFPMDHQVAVNDISYYAARTNPDGPAMTDAIHAIDSAVLDVPGCASYTYLVRSYAPYLKAPFSQTSETPQGGAFNFLTGSGGILQEFQYGFAGLRQQPGSVRLDPSLPPQIHRLTLTNLSWQGRTFTVDIRPTGSTVTLTSGPALPVATGGHTRTVRTGAPLGIPTRRPDRQRTDDIARCRAATASSAAPANPALAAVDGSPATSWTATGAAGSLTVPLDSATPLGTVTVTRGATQPFPYTVQVSANGRNWTTVGTAPASSSGTDRFTVPGTGRYRYVRLVFPGGAGARSPSIAEVLVSKRSG